MDAVEEVKSRLAIEDVIAQYVELKRSGRNLKGLSPFTSERTASFMVSPEKQIWHDFSSGKGGNMFSFVMEMEGLDFKGALELMARKAGVDLSQYRSQRDGDFSKRKERLQQALEAAARFYQVQFSKNKAALEYIFKQRAFTKEIVLQFRIGYSPNNGAALADFLAAKGYSPDELKQAGLVTQRYRSPNDMFRGRIMIPLMDPFGQVIGFTARLLIDDKDAPKYINTPQTILYDKSRHVFGLHLAKEAIRKTGYAVLVEGNMDVIASHQADMRQTVATAGTALTANQLKALGGFTQDIRLSFDADKAGLTAAERSIPIAAKVGVSLGMINLGKYKDPDELIKDDPQAWAKTIEKKQYALDWLIDRYQGQLDLTSAPGKRQFSDVLLAVVRDLPDSVEQDHYVGVIAKLIGVSQDALRSKLNKNSPAAPRLIKKSESAQPTDRQQQEIIKTQNKLLSICLLRPDMRNYLEPLLPEMFASEAAKAIATYLRDNKEASSKVRLAPQLQLHTDYVKILTLQFEELYQSLETLELRYEAARLQAKVVERYVKTKKAVLAEAMRENHDEPAMQDLLKQAKALDRLLKEVKPPNP